MPESGAPRHAEIGTRTILSFAAFAVGIAALRASGSLLLPLLVAVFFAVLGVRPTLWLERKLPAWLAVTVVVTGMVGVLVGFGGLLYRSVHEFTDAAPRYQVRLLQLGESFGDWLDAYGIHISDEQIVAALGFDSILGFVGNALTGIVDMFTNTMLVVLTIVFMLLEAAGLPRKLRAALNDPEADLGRFARITDEIQRYLVMKTWISIGTGLLVAGLNLALGVDFPLLWGLIAFLLNYIPNVGSILAAIPAMVVAAVGDGFGTVVLLGLGYVVINTVLGNIVEPHVMGRKLGLSSLVVFISLVFWNWVWGVTGALLAVPLTMIVKIALEQSSELGWIAVLLDQPPAPTRSDPPPTAPTQEPPTLPK